MYKKETMKNEQRFNAVIIGCGAIVQEYHLPILTRLRNVSVIQLIDSDAPRLRLLARKYGIKNWETKYSKIDRAVDLAFIALPNYLHAPVAVDLLHKGIHVFCEKPMATTYPGAVKMMRAAQLYRRKLFIGMIRRYFFVYKELKRIITTLELGRPLSFKYEEGYLYEWPVRSLYVFNKKEAGGGVLMDTGSHVLDLLSWFFGPAGSYIYYDDNYDGVEANARIKIMFTSKNHRVSGSIELSRNRDLLNKFVVYFEEGKAILDITNMDELTVLANNRVYIRRFSQDFSEAIESELTDFINMVTFDKENVYLPDIAKTIKVIRNFYKNKQPLLL